MLQSTNVHNYNVEMHKFLRSPPSQCATQETGTGGISMLQSTNVHNYNVEMHKFLEKPPVPMCNAGDWDRGHLNASVNQCAQLQCRDAQIFE